MIACRRSTRSRRRRCASTTGSTGRSRGRATTTSTAGAITPTSPATTFPIVFFFTGLHADYHQVTDEPQYIDYPHYSRIVNFVKDLAIDVGNLPTRPKVDRSGAIPPRPIKQ